MKIISIDPGKEGGIAILQMTPASIKLLSAYSMPDLYTALGKSLLRTTLSEWIEKGVEVILIEEQASRGGNSAQSSFSHGRGYGMLEMAINLSIGNRDNVSILYVSPAAWMRGLPEITILQEFMVPGIKDTKKRTLSLTVQHFPKAPIKTKRGAYLDGIADAIMLGWWYLQGGGKEHIINRDKTLLIKNAIKTKKVRKKVALLSPPSQVTKVTTKKQTKKTQTKSGEVNNDKRKK